MYGKWIKPFFIVAGLYDAILGIAFLFCWQSVFHSFGVPPPNHPGYVQFSALLLLVFGAMFFNIARDPVRNRNLIPYGVGLKIAYSGTVLWHHFTGGVPSMWLPWAWADLVFLALFLLAWKELGEAQTGRG